MPRSWTTVALSLALFLNHGASTLLGQMPTSNLFPVSPAVATFSSSTFSEGEALSEGQAVPVRTSGKRETPHIRPFSTAGIAVTVGTLGIGGQLATPLSQRTNLRVGGNFFSYSSATYTNDGIDYSGTLKLRSATALLDWFPFGGSFHLSPGVQFYNGLNASGGLTVKSGQSFTLNSTSYVSSSTTPVTGTASLTTNVAAPMFTFGWGNLVPRRGHISVPFELGFVYQGAPKIAIALAGKACDTNGLNCRDVTTDAAIQSNLAAQRKIVSDDVAQYFRFYPVISIGLSYKF